VNEPVKIPKRKSLTRSQKAKIYSAAGGRCHICSRKIQAGEKWDADHIIPREITGSDAPASFAPAHISCHRGKTAKDKKVIAKVKRTQQKHLGLEKRRKRMGYRKFDGTPVWPGDNDE
jgi:hypothetical protein